MTTMYPTTAATLEYPPTRASTHAHLDERLQRIEDTEVVNLSPAGQALQRFALGHVHWLPGCGFQDGGCWALAAALHQYLIAHGVGAHLVVAGRPFHIDHVVVSVSAGGPSPLYLDSDGVGSLSDLSDKLRVLERLPTVTLSPLDERAARHEGLSDLAELGLVDDLARSLREAFSDRLARHLRHWPARRALTRPATLGAHP